MNSEAHQSSGSCRNVPPNADNPPRRILLIDDDALGSGIVAIALRSRGFHVSMLHDSTAAADTVARERPELILLDIIMPQMSGLDVLKQLRSMHSPIELPVVMLTSLDGSSDIAECLKLGANDYLTKPFDVEVAIARITTQLTLVDLNRDSVRRKQLEALNAMIVTYNHEINNPLAIAMLSLGKDVSALTQENLDTAGEAIRHIAEIVKKIEAVTSREIEMRKYAGVSRMIQL